MWVVRGIFYGNRLNFLCCWGGSVVGKSMSFTDEDLKRLKEDAARDQRIGLQSANRIVALIARLEAAEDLISCRDPYNLRNPAEERAVQIWRKTAGKE